MSGAKRGLAMPGPLLRRRGGVVGDDVFWKWPGGSSDVWMVEYAVMAGFEISLRAGALYAALVRRRLLSR